jgi:hypothetical protein
MPSARPNCCARPCCYEAEGLHGIAQHLRRQAENLSLHRPLAGVLPSVEHLLGPDARPPPSMSPTRIADQLPAVLPFTSARPKAKKKDK